MMISAIVTTYNWPEALGSVLRALLAQTEPGSFEILVADDGSGPETAHLITSLKNPAIRHIWQPDEGFRAAAARNRAIAAAKGDYIVFLDGDCIPRTDFIAFHRALAQPGSFVVGNRVLLNQSFTKQVLTEQLPLYQWNIGQWALACLKGDCNRFLPFLKLPIYRFSRAHRWQGAKGCNLAVWKKDLVRVNGWEEEFTGWGYEDSDLVIRLMRSGLTRKDGHYAVPVIHLWHAEHDRTRERYNWAMLEARQKESNFVAQKGLKQL